MKSMLSSHTLINCVNLITFLPVGAYLFLTCHQVDCAQDTKDRSRDSRRGDIFLDFKGKTKTQNTVTNRTGNLV